jgi:hypothetical protein
MYVKHRLGYPNLCVKVLYTAATAIPDGAASPYIFPTCSGIFLSVFLPKKFRNNSKKNTANFPTNSLQLAPPFVVMRYRLVVSFDAARLFIPLWSDRTGGLTAINFSWRYANHGSQRFLFSRWSVKS